MYATVARAVHLRTRTGQPPFHPSLYSSHAFFRLEPVSCGSIIACPIRKSFREKNDYATQKSEKLHVKQ